MLEKINIPLEELRFDTDRFIIRPFKMSDIGPSYKMNLDPEVSRYTCDGDIPTEHGMEKRIIEDVFGDYEKFGFGRLAIEWKENGKFIGFTGLKYLDDLDVVDIGYRLKKEYWGLGIATEAGKISIDLGFNKLGLERIIAMILPQNTNSIRVAEKLGMQFKNDIEEQGQLARVYEISKWF